MENGKQHVHANAYALYFHVRMYDDALCLRFHGYVLWLDAYGFRIHDTKYLDELPFVLVYRSCP